MRKTDLWALAWIIAAIVNYGSATIFIGCVAISQIWLAAGVIIKAIKS